MYRGDPRQHNVDDAPANTKRNHSGGKNLANGISRQEYYWLTLQEDSISKRTRKFYDERGIKLIMSTPRYLKSNGLAESNNKTIVNTLTKGRWVEELPFVLWANRTTLKTSTCQTPFLLVYGREAILPIESQVSIVRHANINRNSIDLSYDEETLDDLQESVLLKMASPKSWSNDISTERLYIISKVIGNGAYRQ
ncbi:hypothetical protein OSB04_003520 [Centaurea solstitialis]|uniref:Integrase catalytic domain-containing protein n=1 Tax=Centaurea solstitialis TaxID=347529 RepID=A0AA38TVA5_9ASTR|nr:hypothetical protein OSB04_003520 [Centaurea solstitialis]